MYREEKAKGNRAPGPSVLQERSRDGLAEDSARLAVSARLHELAASLLLCELALITGWLVVGSDILDVSVWRILAQA